MASSMSAATMARPEQPSNRSDNRFTARARFDPQLPHAAASALFRTSASEDCHENRPALAASLAVAAMRRRARAANVAKMSCKTLGRKDGIPHWARLMATTRLRTRP
jgi:hypothetical protein